MTLKEIRERMMRAAGIESIAEDKFFILNWLPIINEAQEQVSRELKAPTRYVYTDNFSGSTLPYPADMWEDGLMSVKWNYKAEAVPLQIVSLRTVERDMPRWSATDFTDTRPTMVLYDPPEAKLQMKLLPTPTAAADYAIMYHAKPLPMMYDSHEALSVYDNDGTTRLSTLNYAHELIAFRAAFLYCRKQMYRSDLAKEVADGYAARAKALEMEYTVKSKEIFNEQSGGVILVQSPFLDLEVL